MGWEAWAASRAGVRPVLIPAGSLSPLRTVAQKSSIQKLDIAADFPGNLESVVLKKIPTLVKGKTWRKCCTSRLAFRGESRDARFSPDFGAATPSLPLALRVHDPGIRWEG